VALKLNTVSAGYTHRGKRPNNEDSFAADDRHGIYIVADGMGGARGGDMASRLLAAEVMEYVSSRFDRDENAETESGLVAEAIRYANGHINEIALRGEVHAGMGTTAVVCIVRGGTLYAGWVGDSRAYFLRGGKIKRLTKDHSYVQSLLDSGLITEEEAREHPERHVITRAVGVESDVAVDLVSISLREGDMVILCSDGVHGVLDDRLMENILKVTRDFTEKSRTLVERAIEKGGDDNATALVIAVTGESPLE